MNFKHMNVKIILMPLLLSAMMVWMTTTAIPLRKSIPFVERQQTFYIYEKRYKCTDYEICKECLDYERSKKTFEMD